ncbi:hypothetical protein CK203_064376 [Vitis vinifera]|uniref:Uncharacterized protein n=1 Tax=Vitis vinifera TaxID=29760 RepID=A0A438G6U3_VITVI|nr:hypothetical protein CK203_064376 [Vitis vinifera]
MARLEESELRRREDKRAVFGAKRLNRLRLRPTGQQVEESIDRLRQPYVLNIPEVVAGEHFVLKDLPFYTAMRKVDARSRKARLNNREVKRQEGLLRKAPGGKRAASSPPAGAPMKKKKKKLISNKGKEIKLPTPPKEVVIPLQLM